MSQGSRAEISYAAGAVRRVAVDDARRPRLKRNRVRNNDSAMSLPIVMMLQRSHCNATERINVKSYAER